MEIFKIEFKRAFNNKKFIVALAIGLFLGVFNFVSNTGMNEYYEMAIQYEKYNLEMPSGLFFRNIISSPMELSITLFFYAIPILGAIPFADSYLEDKITGFNKNIFSRTARKNYYISKWFVVFTTAFVICFSICVFNFMLNMTIMPLVHPIIDGMGNSYGLNTSKFLLKLFLNRPVAHFLLFALLLSLYIGVLSTFGLLTAVFSDNRFVAILTPFLLVQVLGIVKNTFRISALYLPNDINTGNGDFDIINVFIQILIMTLLSFVFYVFVENKRSKRIGI